MARAMKCDRCGKYFSYAPAIVDAFAPLIFNADLGNYEFTVDNAKYDLCPECVSSLREWLDSRRTGGTIDGQIYYASGN